MAKEVGITQKSAWFLLHRLRKACEQGGREKLAGKSGKEYVEGMAHPNSIESVWALLKRGF